MRVKNIRAFLAVPVAGSGGGLSFISHSKLQIEGILISYRTLSSKADLFENYVCNTDISHLILTDNQCQYRHLIMKTLLEQCVISNFMLFGQN